MEDDTIQLNGIPEILNESTVLACIDKIIEEIQMGALDKGEIAHTVLAQLAFAGSMTYKLGQDQTVIADFVAQLFTLKTTTTRLLASAYSQRLRTNN